MNNNKSKSSRILDLHREHHYELESKQQEIDKLMYERDELKQEIEDLNGMIKFYVRCMKIKKEREANQFTKKEIDCGIRDNFKEDMIDELYREQDSYETGF